MKKIEKTKREEFLSELTDLTKKYGIAIGGCGCCGSPFLFSAGEDGPVSGREYRVELGGADLEWVPALKGEEIDILPGLKTGDSR
jgi:hypothetical protein